MHVRGEKMRQVTAILGAAVVAGTLATTVASASATATTAIALKGSIAGGIKVTSNGDTDTFVFTETNHRTVAVDEFLVFTKVVNTSVEDVECVFPGGFTGNADGTTCEPTLKPGQSVSLVLTTQVTGTVSGTTASVQACTYNGNGGASGPCTTASAKIG